MSFYYSAYPELSDINKEIIQAAGETLYMVQLAEKAIKLSNICIFNSIEFLEDNLYSQEVKIRKKTIGQLIDEIKRNAKINAEFETILQAFLESRNFFIHHIFTEPEYQLSAKDNCNRVYQFLLTLQDKAIIVQNIFIGLIITWAQKTDLDKHFPDLLKSEFNLNRFDQQIFQRLSDLKSKLTPP